MLPATTLLLAMVNFAVSMDDPSTNKDSGSKKTLTWGAHIEVPREIDAGVFFFPNHRKRTVVIRVKNAGTEPLEIPFVLSACTPFACVSTNRPSTPIPPGESIDVAAEIEVSVDAKLGKGYGQTGFESNSLVNKHAWVRITGELRSPVELQTKKLTLERKGEWLVARSEVRKSKGYPIVPDVRIWPCTLPNVEAVFDAADREKGDLLGHVTIRMPRRKVVRKGTGEISLAVEGIISRECIAFDWPAGTKLYSEPACIILRGVPANGKCESTVIIHGTSPFTIRSIQPESATVKAVCETREASSSHKVKLTFTPSSTVGLVQTKLKVATDLPDDSELEVRLMAMVTKPR